MNLLYNSCFNPIIFKIKPNFIANLKTRWRIITRKCEKSIETDHWFESRLVTVFN